jgi:hypothetical protein
MLLLVTVDIWRPSFSNLRVMFTPTLSGERFRKQNSLQDASPNASSTRGGTFAGEIDLSARFQTRAGSCNIDVYIMRPHSTTIRLRDAMMVLRILESSFVQIQDLFVQVV